MIWLILVKREIAGAEKGEARMAEETRTIGYLCPVCGGAVVVARTRFQLAAADSHLPCPCGKSELTIRQLGDRCELIVPCALCARDHRVFCSNRALQEEPLLALTCSVTGLGCCYIGEEDAVFRAMRQLEQAVDKLVEDGEAGRHGAFLDEVVMAEVLGEIGEIARRGGISCGCGCRAYGIRVSYSAVELTCAQCGAVLHLPAATADDLDRVCARYTLTIPGKKES